MKINQFKNCKLIFKKAIHNKANLRQLRKINNNFKWNKYNKNSKNRKYNRKNKNKRI